MDIQIKIIKSSDANRIQCMNDDCDQLSDYFDFPTFSFNGHTMKVGSTYIEIEGLVRYCKPCVERIYKNKEFGIFDTKLWCFL